MSVKENLIKAKALIDTPEKWLKGALDGDGCFCAVGAVGEARDWDMDAFLAPEFKALLGQLPTEFQKGTYLDVPNYNDHPDTTHADIMALFDRAIEIAGDA